MKYRTRARAIITSDYPSQLDFRVDTSITLVTFKIFFFLIRQIIFIGVKIIIVSLQYATKKSLVELWAGSRAKVSKMQGLKTTKNYSKNFEKKKLKNLKKNNDYSLYGRLNCQLTLCSLK